METHTSGASTSVLIVEDDARCRQAFADAVRGAADLHLAGVAADLETGMSLLERLHPDVLLVDIGLPDGSGITLIEHARRHLPQCESLVVTVFADDLLILQCIEAGASGYLLKDDDAVDIAKQIRLLRQGGSPISPAIARRLLVHWRRSADGAGATDGPQAVLSVQEERVLALSAKGYNYEEVARLLGLSRHTVETYVKRMYRKLQVHSKTEAVFEARKQGLLRG